MSKQQLSIEQTALNINQVAAAMREKASGLGASGVSEILTKDHMIAHLELIGIPENELNLLSNMSLVLLLQEINSSGQYPACIVPVFDIVGRYTREPDPEHRGEGDPGINYLQFVHGKLAQSLRTGQSSGGDNVRRGEAGVEGAIFHDEIITAFSGGTTDQDVEIAKAGISAYIQLLIGQGRLEYLSELDKEIAEKPVSVYLSESGAVSDLVMISDDEVTAVNDRLNKILNWKSSLGHKYLYAIDLSALLCLPDNRSFSSQELDDTINYFCEKIADLIKDGGKYPLYSTEKLAYKVRKILLNKCFIRQVSDKENEYRVATVGELASYTPIEQLDLGGGISNLLFRANIPHLEGIEALIQRGEINTLRNIGPKRKQQILDSVATHRSS